MSDKQTPPKTCEHCSHWFRHRIFGPVDPVTKKRKLEQMLDTGGCERMKSHMIDIEGKLDEIQCPMPHSGGHGEGQSGGYVCTGKDFGCIHFRARAEEKDGWTQDGKAPAEPKAAPKPCPSTIQFRGETLHCQDVEGHDACHYSGHLNWHNKKISS